MTRRHVLFLVSFFLLASCGFGDPSTPEAPAVAFGGEPARADSAWSRGYSAAPAPDASELERELHGRYSVAPDRALVRVEATAHASTRDGVASRIHGATRELARALAIPGACEVQRVDFGTPVRVGDAWHDTATLRIDIPLAGVADVAERFARVERCMEGFGTMGANVSDLALAVSHPLPTIDDPSAHRAALLERALRPHREVASTQGPAAFDPDGVRCVSRGDVTITERSLRGVALAVDLECVPRPATAVAPHVAG